MVSWDYNEFIYKPQNSVQTSSFMWYPFSNHLFSFVIQNLMLLSQSERLSQNLSLNRCTMKMIFPESFKELRNLSPPHKIPLNSRQLLHLIPAREPLSMEGMGEGGRVRHHLLREVHQQPASISQPPNNANHRNH